MRSIVLALALIAGPVSAHELWLEPEDFTIAPEATMTVEIVNGSDFVGQSLPYLPQRFAAFMNFTPEGASNVPGRIGDQPAVQSQPPAEGLNVLAYQSRENLVTYNDWQTILDFVEHKDLTGFLEAHAARGFAQEPFTEIYSRYSKSLIGVGNAQGSDQRTGLETEIVALTNPYTDDLSDGMRFQLWYRDAPRANVRFEVFDRAPDGRVTQTFYVTDAQGMVSVPVQPGHDYMADAVLIREPSQRLAEANNAAWETLWANMTWGTPAP
ncbi:hypothetical protein AN189_16670 [Loktanella sp. 3ANDIMAR09]|uniref:DUF4198 domain-containing protein n=1 Tax=Loktanella sp. 3ANDIMAR09 TaxID=1225657 RepID=UPI000707F8E5|nr:DUF4198 domain-containing protein [Loktanella sp. 3ANDIMAR09]KQI67229.1 hypothetical protein AN189_16670 [Loktanella sp. 3ANDIMAR09]